MYRLLDCLAGDRLAGPATGIGNKRTDFRTSIYGVHRCINDWECHALHAAELSRLVYFPQLSIGILEGGHVWRMGRGGAVNRPSPASTNLGDPSALKT